MEKLGLDLDDGSSPSDQKQANPQEAKKLAIQRCIQSLVHACQCRDANCHLQGSQKLKRVVQHNKICKRKTNGDCPICKQFFALCCYHAKHCQETKCPVPFCLNIKRKMKQLQLKQRLQQAQLLHRRMAVMNSRTTVPTGALPGNSVAGSLTSGTVSPAGIMTSPPNPNNMIVGGIQSAHTPGIGLKHGTQTPSANVLQVIKQVQEEAARQQAPHAQGPYGKNTPLGVVGGQAQVMPPPPMQSLLGQMGPGPHLMPMSGGTVDMEVLEQLTPRYGSNPALQQNTGLRQPNPGGLMPQQQQVVQVPPQSQQAIGCMGPSLIVPGPNIRTQPGTCGTLVNAGAGSNAPGGSSIHKPALQQLLAILKSPKTPEQPAQILQILKSDPELVAELMALFIKHLQEFQLAQAWDQNQANAAQGSWRSHGN